MLLVACCADHEIMPTLEAEESEEDVNVGKIAQLTSDDRMRSMQIGVDDVWEDRSRLERELAAMTKERNNLLQRCWRAETLADQKYGVRVEIAELLGTSKLANDEALQAALTEIKRLKQAEKERDRLAQELRDANQKLGECWQAVEKRDKVIEWVIKEIGPYPNCPPNGIKTDCPTVSCRECWKEWIKEQLK